MYDSNCVAFWKRQNHRDSKKLSGGQGLGDGGMNRQSTGLCWGVKIILYDPVMVDTCHCAFVQTRRMYNPRVTPNVNSGLWVIVMSWCRFINSHKWTPLVGDIDSEEG